MDKEQLNAMIDEMYQKLEDTKTSTQWRRSAVDETLQVVIPMMEDAVVIMRRIVDES